MPNGPFGEYFHIPFIAANAWTGHPGGVTYEMYENKSTDFDAAMNNYVTATSDFGEEEDWMWEEDEDAVDKAIFQLKKGPAAPGSFMTPFGPALADEAIAEVVQEYPGAGELTGDMQEMFDAAEDFIEDGGEDFDDFVYELEDFAEESGNDIWSVISGAGSAIADKVQDLALGAIDLAFGEPDPVYAGDEFTGSPLAVPTLSTTPVPEPKEEGDSIWDKFMDVLTVTGTAEMQGGPALVEAGMDWLGDTAENYFEIVGETATFKNAVDSAALDYVFGEGTSPATDAKFAKIEDDKYFKDSIKELDLQLNNEGLPAMLAFIEAELGGAVDQDVVEDWVDILRQRGDEFSLAAADDIAITLDRSMIGGMGLEPPDVTEPAVGLGTETTPTTLAEDISKSYWTPGGGVTGPAATTPSGVTLEQDIGAGDEATTTVEPDVEAGADVPLGDEGDAEESLDVDTPIADYETQFNRYFSTLGGSSRYEAQQGKRALFRDAEMLFYLNKDWSDREWLDPATLEYDPDIQGAPWEIEDPAHVEKEEDFFYSWLDTDYFGKPQERYGPDFYESVWTLRNDMHKIRNISEDDFYEQLGSNKITYDLATDRAAFMRGDDFSNYRLASLVSAYNIHPGADTWMKQEMRRTYADALTWWVNDGRKPEDFMYTFVKDEPGTEGAPPGQPQVVG